MEETITLKEVAGMLITGCFLLLVTSFMAWRNGYYKLPPKENEERLPSNVLMTAFALFLLFSIAIGPLLSASLIYLFTGHLNTHSQMVNILISSLSIVATFLALLTFFFSLSAQNKALIVGKYFGPATSLKKTFDDMLLGFLSWFIAFPFVMVAGKLVYLILYLFGAEVIPNQLAVNEVKTSLDDPLLFSFMALDIILFVPILEEFIFRGCLQTWLRGRIGVVKAILLTSTIFAAFHFSFAQGLGNFELLVSLFILSCFLGFIYERQHSLLASISLHAFFNAVTVAVILIAKE